MPEREINLTGVEPQELKEAPAVKTVSNIKTEQAVPGSPEWFLLTGTARFDPRSREEIPSTSNE